MTRAASHAVTLTVSLLLASCTWFREDPEQPIWETSFGGDGSDRATDIAATEDGGFVVVGTFETTRGGTSLPLLLRLDARGDMLWSRRYDSLRHGAIPRSVRSTPDRGLLLAGSTALPPGAFVLKADSLGQEEWLRTWTGVTGYSAYCARPTSDGGYVVTGYGPGIAWLEKLLPDGSTDWTAVLDSALSGVGRSVEQTPDGGYVVGMLASGGFPTVVRTDDRGRELWRYIHDRQHGSNAFSAIPTWDGGCFCVGYTGVRLNYYYDGVSMALMLDSAGNRVSCDSFTYPLCSVVEVEPGAYLAVGSGTYSRNGYLAWGLKVTRFDITGEEVWTRHYGGRAEGHAICLARDGFPVAAGLEETFVGGTPAYYQGDFYVVKVRP